MLRLLVHCGNAARLYRYLLNYLPLFLQIPPRSGRLAVPDPLESC